MAIPPAPAGYTRFLMKSKFGAGRDFRVLDPQTETELFLVDGKIGTRPKADIQDAQGTVQYRVRGNLLGIPKRMNVLDADDTEIAHLHAQPFKFLKDKIDVTLASGEEWLLEGNLIEKNYAVNDSGGRHVVQITQKWVQIRDQYIIDVADGVEPAVAFALVWAVDRWVERD
ncbi:LURP-one-related family protein [Phycicoccus sp. CSK15P-2]|uniref:LURP-one-related/scramblase family protein n=1 Tax=Phycicoccus sp. CSK15P-2 TaxID=2807627 RepID=UPI00194FFBC5|nr:LURP-one-related family protein [Phycicoccus sp. CSK15P-2]MBM6405549.1 LURP-one-related family protein [Phycicoccus sp. CSK15P-2]